MIIRDVGCKTSKTLKHLSDLICRSSRITVWINTSSPRPRKLSMALEPWRFTKSRLIGARDDREDTDDATGSKDILGIILNHSESQPLQFVWTNQYFSLHTMHISSIRMGLLFFSSYFMSSWRFLFPGWLSCCRCWGLHAKPAVDRSGVGGFGIS